jgi:hypothetical protein
MTTSFKYIPLTEEHHRLIFNQAIEFGWMNQELSSVKRHLLTAAIQVISSSKGLIPESQQVAEESIKHEEPQLQQMYKEYYEKMVKMTEKEIEFALALDFQRRIDGNRPDRNSGEPTIDVCKVKQFTNIDRSAVVHLLTRWKYNDPRNKGADRKKLAQAACRLVAYDSGFAKPPSGTSVDKWIAAFEASLKGDRTKLSEATNKKKMGCKNGTYLLEDIKQQKPGYLHKMWRESCQKNTSEATC